MSLSTGSGGRIFFLMPPKPAIKQAENARYGLAAGSGERNSIRFDLGLVEYIGMRTHAERFRFEYTRVIGASYPGTSRRYELVVGAQSASRAGACLRMPPM